MLGVFYGDKDKKLENPQRRELGFHSGKEVRQMAGSSTLGEIGDSTVTLMVNAS